MAAICMFSGQICSACCVRHRDMRYTLKSTGTTIVALLASFFLLACLGTGVLGTRLRVRSGQKFVRTPGCQFCVATRRPDCKRNLHRVIARPCYVNPAPPINRVSTAWGRHSAACPSLASRLSPKYLELARPLTNSPMLKSL